MPDNGVNHGDSRMNLSREIPFKHSEAAFSKVFFRRNFRPEVVSDVISGANVGPVVFGIDVPVKIW